jgi:MOSC domain-containing protein YiiM
MGLQRELHGQRGILCRVIAGGRIQRGDAIQIQLAPAGVAASHIGGEL